MPARSVNKVIINGSAVIDITDTTATASDVAPGKYFYGADGAKTLGTSTAVITGTESINEPESLDVDFIDYDGTLLYSYTAEDFLKMTSMPPNPSHAGLVAQGWNWTLADAKEIVQECGFNVIGQNYTTSDGKSRIYITVNDKDLTELQQVIIYGISADYTIDWGDGGSTVLTNQNYYKTSTHTYQNSGDYVITIEVTNGEIIFGYYGTNNGVVWGNGAMWNAAIKRVRKIEVGDNVARMGTQPFTMLYNLETVSLPANISNDNNPKWSGSGMTKIKGFVIPKNVKTISNINAVRTRFISYPHGITSIGRDNYLSNVEKIVLPNSITSLSETYCLRDCHCLQRLHLPNGITSIPKNFCSNSGEMLEEITIPSGVTDIAAHAFNGSRLLRIHLKPTTPPTLENSNAFPNLATTAVVYVPYSEDHSILEAYQTATNWSSFASKMIEEEP